MFNLENKKILITGGNKGIGYAYADALLKQGAEVVITGRAEKDNKEALNNLVKISKNISYINYNSDKDRFEDIFQKVGFVDTLILNHGILEFKNDESYIQKLIDTNLKSYLLISEIYGNFIKNNTKQNSGNVIFTSSISSIKGMSIDPVYAISKSGIVNLSISLALKYGKYNVRFNCIAPGWIETDLFEKLLDLSIGQKVVDNVLSRTPLRRIGTVDDLKGIVVFLSSDESKFITGQNFVVDGGFSIS